jgi:CDP-diacylglycerol--glycerol-3-phosphate 3-phosphatidyltransferase
MSTEISTSPTSAVPNFNSIPDWKRRLPMQLTFARMALCPLLVILLLREDILSGWLAALIFMIASVTDWLDGWFARRYHAQSNMGKFMDPIADKILVASALIMLIPTGRIHPILVLVLLARDILIGGIRSVAAADNLIIDAKPTGKWKTALQMVAIPAILIKTPIFNLPIAEIGNTLLWVSVGLSVISAYQYVQLYADVRAVRKQAKRDKRKQAQTQRNETP